MHPPPPDTATKAAPSPSPASPRHALSNLAMSMVDVQPLNIQGLLGAAQLDRSVTSEAHTKCTQWKGEIAHSDFRVGKLMKALKESGCPFTQQHLVCTVCPPGSAGGFHPEHGIILCENTFKEKSHMAETLAHELVHAFDYCRVRCDWNNVRHHACTEIRAALLSGDCSVARELKRGNFNIQGQMEKCIKRRAALAISINPNLPAGSAAKVIDEVYATCVNDTAPFSPSDIDTHML
ncbi:peptidase M76 family-domain-containing protein [Polychytrium aggregatum]|uniref:peptidase M76 family-domain-containing protein n=1 Tax=Polychytrium aggregatum TaxID=110093 RepID=UPI0022FDEE42|nr:peptidase M76 family-domain-containing protein [Polychytrium aggregatum]KAI9197122.1 peptidase M76 family-domain-containing protein [Polychytrium aggregatum]